ncbi:NusG domain II-containing protein [Syntrophotalea acetylenica]|jgi:hypothetical protein|uniref:NusG domain II-containing protein n=1 Tax=Syntrophotalea TaxID=2812025 RepID=UPI002A36245A|nr:NusG domain II-containing protein [Syntrophotalea acetylenica]MDY0261753.1 NusG domain II-containing protein [Syntrophotalea acetylenica]
MARKCFTLWDCLVVAVLLITALASWLLMPHADGAMVIVERQGRVLFRAPLHCRREVSLDGPLGPTVISIENGWVRVKNSSCPRHLCQHHKAIRRSGEMLACLPNGLVIRVAGPVSVPEPYDFLSH